MDFEAEMEAAPLSAEQEAQLKSLAVERAPAALAKLAAATTEVDRFYALSDATIAAFNLEAFDRARELADALLELAPAYQGNWNYGNAIHAGHTVLGLLALQGGNVPVSIDELRKSGEIPGSPQLDTFGPSMQLAKALLMHSEFLPVLTYFKQCRAFWKMGNAWLDIWERKVSNGTIPNFFMHSYR